jgi:hypothetical protein
MKIEIIENSLEPVVFPAIGQFWKHKQYQEIYLRIDEKSPLIQKLCEDKNRFWSVCLTDDQIYNTSSNSTDIIILEPPNNTLTLHRV